MSGYEVAREIRRRRCDVTLVALTGWGQPRDRELTKEAGFDHHLVKSLDLEVLEVILSDLRVEVV